MKRSFFGIFVMFAVLTASAQGFKNPDEPCVFQDEDEEDRHHGDHTDAGCDDQQHGDERHELVSYAVHLALLLFGEVVTHAPLGLNVFRIAG